MSHPSVRTDLFLLAHDDAGRPLGPEPNLSAGLAGATLAGLLLDRAVAVTDGRLDVVDPTPTGDDEDDTTLAAILASEAPCGPRAWVSWISSGAYERVATSAVTAGLVKRSVSRRLGLVPAVRYPPADAADLVRARSRLRYAVVGQQPADAATAALCGLVRVLRLESTLLLGLSAADVLLALERQASTSDLTVRQVISAVETVISLALFR
jgi:hypothetical protein